MHTERLSKYISADKLFVDPVDLERDRQRDPEERKNHLIKLYGPRGGLWRDDLAGAISVKERQDNKFAIKDGAGRWWAVMNLLRQPRKELLCVVLNGTGDLEAFKSLNSGVHIPKGKMFMARGNDPKNTYEHRICNVLRQHDLTTVPGRGWRTVSINSVCFAYDLGVLYSTLTLAKRYWCEKTTLKGKIKYRRMDGYLLAGLAAFIFLYQKKREFDPNRLDHILGKIPLEETIDEARMFLPPKKEHARQWAVAICKTLVRQYNRGTRKTAKMNSDDIGKLQERVANHQNYSTIHRDVWEMRQVVR